MRFSWNFGNYYTHKSDAAKIDVARNAPALQRETFLFNTNQVESSQSELEKYRRTLSDDDRIVALRDNIKRASEAKVAEGTMSVTDYYAGSNQSRNGAAEPRTAPDATDHDDIQPTEKYNQQLI